MDARNLKSRCNLLRISDRVNTTLDVLSRRIERAQSVELNGLPHSDQLNYTLRKLGENTYNHIATVDAVVVGNVLCETAKRESLVGFQLGVLLAELV